MVLIMEIVGVWNIYRERNVIDQCVKAVTPYVDKLLFGTLEYLLSAEFDVPHEVIAKEVWESQMEKLDVMLNELSYGDWMMYIGADLANFMLSDKTHLKAYLSRVKSPGLLCYTIGRGWGHRFIRKGPIVMTADHHHTYLGAPRLYIESTKEFARCPYVVFKEIRPHRKEMDHYAITVNKEEARRRAYLVKHVFGFELNKEELNDYQFQYYLNRWLNGEGKQLIIRDK